jgi:uncharacterized protein YbaR (Trm112 family)
MERMALPQILKDLLVCPKCHGELRFLEERGEIHCPACRLLFRIEDDVPNMLLEEAAPLPPSAP